MNKMNKGKAAAAFALLAALLLTACGADPKETEKESGATAPAPSLIEITADTSSAPETETIADGETLTITESETTVPETTAKKQEPFDESDLVLTVDGVELSLRMDFAPLAGKLYGGVFDEQVGQACVGGGNDRAYLYGGGEFSVYTVGSASGAQTIYDIFIDGVQGFSTAKGAVIGTSTREEIRAVYGEPSFSSLAADRYSEGALDLIFSFDNNDVLSAVGLHDNDVQ